MFRRVYLDNSATTQVDPAVVEAMLPFLTETFGNASSIHHFGQAARAAVDKARHRVADLLNARPNEVVFTSGGTESNNLAIRGLIESRAMAGDPPPHVVISAIEHPAVHEVCVDLEARGLCELTQLPVYDNGIIRMDDLRDAVRENTLLISVMAANNEIGTLQPIREIGEYVRSIRSGSRRIYFHTDAVQAAGKVPLDVEEIGCDLLSISGHKIHSPKGIGALYVRRGTKLHPQNIGGRQERAMRAGTEPVSQIVAIGAAAELAESGVHYDFNSIRTLRDVLEHRTLEMIDGASVNGDTDQRLPNITNISFEGVEGEGLLISLDMKGIAVSTGSACSSGSLEPSPVIRALGRSDEAARTAIRFSLSKFNTEADIDRVLEVLPASIDALRRISHK
jgi:cysteine desulfurase